MGRGREEGGWGGGGEVGYVLYFSIYDLLLVICKCILYKYVGEDYQVTRT